MKVEQDRAAMACAELSESLWRVRDLLELLAYRVEVQRALVETGRATWVARSTRDVDQLLQQIRNAELLRAVETARPPRPCSCPTTPPSARSLRQLLCRGTT